ncbi:MAG TPA: GNAT family N-acetyltransferase [Nitrosospira sp.]|nr:GNAT family N-acetyltransferase [Nitrosospira sp.]
MGHLHEQGEHLSARATSITCRPDRIAYSAMLDGNTLLLQPVNGVENSRWQLDQQADQLTLEWMGSDVEKPKLAEVLAAIEAAFVSFPVADKLNLLAPFDQVEELLRSGLLLRDRSGQATVNIELFWQQPRMWLVPPQPCSFPVTYMLSEGRRHPLRPPKPAGIVYQRHIDWLGRTLSFRTVDLHRDLERFNRWMNDPVVAASWREEGDLAKHQAYLHAISADSHVTALIASLDDEAFGYFEVYWAKEDRIAPFYDVDDFDRGWHVLIGEARFRGKPFVTAWLPSISHYLFLDDCRTQRVVIEPRTDNYKMIRNLARCGYANLKEFDFPHKRAMLGMLLRERFFAERLWVPRDVIATSCSISSLS